MKKEKKPFYMKYKNMFIYIYAFTNSTTYNDVWPKNMSL